MTPVTNSSNVMHNTWHDTVDGSEIPNKHLGCIKQCTYHDKLPINWCNICFINSISVVGLEPHVDGNDL